MDLVAGIDAVTDALGLPADDGERCAQLMGQVGDKGAPVAVGGRQPRAHRVEGASERLQLSWSAFRHLHAVLAGLDPPGGIDDLAQVDGHPLKTTTAAEDDDHQHEQRRNGEKPDTMRRRDEAERGAGQHDADREHDGDEQKGGGDEPGNSPHESTSHPAPGRSSGRRPGLTLGPPRRPSTATRSGWAPAPATPARWAHRRASAKR